MPSPESWYPTPHVQLYLPILFTQVDMESSHASVPRAHSSSSENVKGIKFFNEMIINENKYSAHGKISHIKQFNQMAEVIIVLSFVEILRCYLTWTLWKTNLNRNSFANVCFKNFDFFFEFQSTSWMDSTFLQSLYTWYLIMKQLAIIWIAGGFFLLNLNK